MLLKVLMVHSSTFYVTNFIVIYTQFNIYWAFPRCLRTIKKFPILYSPKQNQKLKGSFL